MINLMSLQTVPGHLKNNVAVEIGMNQQDTSRLDVKFGRMRTADKTFKLYQLAQRRQEYNFFQSIQLMFVMDGAVKLVTKYFFIVAAH